MGDIVDLMASSTSSSSSAELCRYLDEPVREADPLAWWKQNDNK